MIAAPITLCPTPFRKHYDIKAISKRYWTATRNGYTAINHGLLRMG